MKTLILTSSNDEVTDHFVNQLNLQPKGMKLTYVTTAGEVEEGSLSWLSEDRNALINAGFDVSDFTFTNKSESQVKEMLDATDFLFISGGNTFFLLQQMHGSGFSKMIHSYVENGLLYGGTSAGSIVAGPNIEPTKFLDDPTLAPELTDYTGLGLTDVIVFPHWGSENFAKRYEKLMPALYNVKEKIVLLHNSQYLLVQDEKYQILQK